MIWYVIFISRYTTVGIGYSLAHPSGLKLNEMYVMLCNSFGCFKY